jgi:hypothetical protein
MKTLDDFIIRHFELSFEKGGEKGNGELWIKPG